MPCRQEYTRHIRQVGRRNCFVGILLHRIIIIWCIGDALTTWRRSEPTFKASNTHTPFLPLPVEIDFCVLLLSALCMQQRAHHQHKLSSCAEIQSYISQTPCVTGISWLQQSFMPMVYFSSARCAEAHCARGNEFERIKETLLLRECRNEITHQNALLMRAVEGYSPSLISTRFINFLLYKI